MAKSASRLVRAGRKLSTGVKGTFSHTNGEVNGRFLPIVGSVGGKFLRLSSSLKNGLATSVLTMDNKMRMVGRNL